MGWWNQGLPRQKQERGLRNLARFDLEDIGGATGFTINESNVSQVVQVSGTIPQMKRPLYIYIYISKGDKKELIRR